MKNKWTLYYNPKCGTCRNTLELLRAQGIEPRVIEYLKTPPTLSELQAIAKKLGDRWPEMIRSKEEIYSTLKLGDKSKSQRDLLKAITEHPILLQRPILTNEKAAVVARPPEKAEEILNGL